MFATILVVVHVWAVFWLTAGILGRSVCAIRAGRSEHLETLETLMSLAGSFEGVMVRPGTFVVLVTGLAAAWARGWPILGILQGSRVNWVLVSLLVYMTAIPLIAFIFVPRGRVYRQALEAAREKGDVTPELRAAIQDPLVNAGRAYEVTMIGVLAWLMLAKPF